MAVNETRTIGKADMVLNDYAPRMEVDAQTYEVRAEGMLLTCEPAKVLPLAQRCFVLRQLEPRDEWRGASSVGHVTNSPGRDYTACTNGARIVRDMQKSSVFKRGGFQIFNIRGP